jgi:tetratricopeptide (TPR) repeat protein
MVKGGHFDQALEKLDTIAAKQPEPAGAEYLRAMMFYQMGKMADAAAAFGKAASQDPTNLDAMQMLGVSLFREGKSAEAVPFLERARRSVPNANVDPNYVLGLCYIDTGRYDDARKAFAGQYGFAPESAPAYLLAARMLLRRDYRPIAEQSARKAIALNPNLPRAHFLLGELALAQGQAGDAIAEFQKEADLSPLDGTVYERLGDVYIHMGDFDRAQQALNRAVLLEPNVNIPFILLGKVLLKQKNSLMAKMYLERALEMDPRNYMAHHLLGQTYRALGRSDDAAREYRTAEQVQAAKESVVESTR